MKINPKIKKIKPIIIKIIYNEQKKSDSYTVQKRITPKQGRVVLFDGSYYHTAEQPLNNIRCVVNYDLK